MQLARVWDRCTPVITYLHRAWVACVPSPRQPQLPGASMTAKESAECAKLEPAQVQLGRKFFCGNKSAYVGAPIGNASERCIDADGNLHLERLPGGVDITRPEKRRIPLHAGVPVTVESVGTLIGPVDLRTFPVHPVPSQARCDIQRIAFIRPPAIDSHGKVFAVSIPVTACFLF